MCDSQWISLCVSTAHTCSAFVANWPKLVFRSSHQRPNCQMSSTSNSMTNSIHNLQKTVLFFSLVFINLFLFPNTSHAFRVPYRYPHYPLFHKELIHNSPIGKTVNSFLCCLQNSCFNCSHFKYIYEIRICFQIYLRRNS